MVKVKNVLEWLDTCAPFRYAESWDRCGLQVGDPEADVERILVALDPSSVSLDEAEYRRCQCLVTHHPLLFRSLDAVRQDQFPGRLVIRAIQRGIHLIAAHTNVDAAVEGTNDQMARLMALEELGPLSTNQAWREEERYGGMGRVGCLPEPKRLLHLVRELSAALGGIGARAVGDLNREVRRVALCSGSGGSMLETAVSAGVDVFVTGDLKYHDGQRALEAGLALIDVGHFSSERLIVLPLVETLKSQAARELRRIEVFAALGEKDPFVFVAGE